MITSWWLGAVSVFWLGVLTSVCPLPLAGNLAAVALIGRQVDSPRRIVLSGIAYAGGRVVVYVVLGALIVPAAISAVDVSKVLQFYVNTLLGPILILAGVLLLGLIRIPLPKPSRAERWQGRSANGFWSPALLGLLSALFFGPVAAALFFGSLIPLSVAHRSPVVFPIIYGLGTGLPALIIGPASGMGARWVAEASGVVTQIGRWVRSVAGVLFVIVGVFLTLKRVLAFW